jgi:predicted NAD/FAD-dependent oxidoreductase
VFDKGRGLGGRLATRRSAAGAFDHGAPGVQATGGFAAYLASGGHAAPWGPEGWVGLPGASGLVRPLAEGLDVQTQVEVTGIAPDGAGWRITAGDRTEGPFDQLVLAIPQPQALRLLAGQEGLAQAIAPASMRPVWTAMYAFDAPLPAPDILRPEGGAIALAIRETAKPGRDGAERWVVHAAEGWTRDQLEIEKPDAAARLLPVFLTLAGAPDARPVQADGHRWRFGLTDRALGRPFVRQGNLAVCGDWCLGAGAQDAWDSGRALAADLLR